MTTITDQLARKSGPDFVPMFSWQPPREPTSHTPFAVQATQQPLAPLSFQILLTDLGLPVAGAAAAYRDWFLFLPHAGLIGRSWFSMSSAPAGSGALTIRLVQSLEDGPVADIGPEISLPKPTATPFEMPPQAGLLRTGRPVFLRVFAKPPAAGPVWYLTAGLRLHGTLHFLTRR